MQLDEVNCSDDDDDKIDAEVIEAQAQMNRDNGELQSKAIQARIAEEKELVETECRSAKKVISPAWTMNYARMARLVHGWKSEVKSKGMLILRFYYFTE